MIVCNRFAHRHTSISHSLLHPILTHTHTHTQIAASSNKPGSRAEYTRSINAWRGLMCFIVPTWRGTEEGGCHKLIQAALGHLREGNVQELTDAVCMYACMHA
jgi:hypothetical protein